MKTPELHIKISRSANEQEVTADIDLEGRSWHIFFRSLSGDPLTCSAEALLAASLLPAMKSAAHLRIEEPVSPRFHANLEYIQAIFSAWNPEYHTIEIPKITRSETVPSDGKRTATFFSAGVDSFYSLLKHGDEISDLIFVHGFDIELSDGDMRRKVSSSIRGIARETGKHLIEIETNIREFLDEHVAWGLFGHGPAMACIGHLLSGSLRRVYIPASFSYTRLFPWGTHPLLDHLWGSEQIDFIHDGCEANRVEKVTLLSRHEIAMNNLRVCYQNKAGQFNCGVCQKCVRTMLNLHVIGALEKCRTFHSELDIALVQKLATRDPRRRHYYLQENLDALRRSGKDPQLQKALVTALKKDKKHRKVLRYCRDILRKMRKSPRYKS